MDNKNSKNNFETFFQELKKGLKDTFKDSEKYLSFLQKTSNWKRYSANNIINLWMQCCMRGIEGKYLNTFKGWKELGYSINKGEKAMKILMPSFYKYFKDENEKWVPLKKATKQQLNKIKNNELAVKKIIASFYFKNVIFDISQTNCPKEEYENKIREKLIPKSLEGSQDKKIDFLLFNLRQYIIENEKINVIEKELDESLKGCVNPNEIVLNQHNSNLQSLKTLIHEYAHYKLHISTKIQLQKYQKEIEAESVAYLVCRNFDIDTSDYSFKYINMYGTARTEEELYNSYENINTAAKAINDVLDNALALEMANCFEIGDIVYANLGANDNKKPETLLLTGNEGKHYEAFKIKSGDEFNVASVKIERDNSNNLKKDSTIKMNIKYVVNRNDIVKKIGNVNKENMSEILKYVGIFQNKNITKKVSNNADLSMDKNNIRNGLNFFN
ncbi:ArdC-like ssDNA-binding domain-containing protein [Clostridium sp.]|uniref:ArdC-like ssDNA-binding domain-containing protein n=1 Tax=Clostridium sp. TaxID=1506 RepID=UPI002FDCDC2E